ncbi:MAG: virulence factor Mce family protein [Mycobacterium sp.]|jgi:phospholipid/cholesterol/gamma-HCH transport system substrate-binding protein|uniref:Mammalian cell entry protein n=2 Tax=Mycobacterium gordonae TaxID=1778 RepID=A0A1A6BGF9_MYCGO|nr:virulence factor Mce family protein [Mycobacterium gordonae]MBI2701999.1 virulence factor Mce family protein [Mycobacterium sp.]MBX9979666.1 virulence factor Mce family protein [Mycobacterium gordonae]MCV7007340.1 virulence factor Mce family protein [Mycobacterium gordonae]OBS01442.1 mammalian cell entry protein [Mycobacterium gordonae]ORV96375.1 mammalian cell entry protein [Mycobacterium gordonae]
MNRTVIRLGLGAVLVLTLLAGVVTIWNGPGGSGKTTVVAYFQNSNGIFAGDEVRILGVAVGKIDTIEPQPQRVKITFFFDSKYPVPADAKAVILSPSLVTSRAIQLTPAYTGGPQLRDHAVIPLERTAVPVEWDDLRSDLERLTQMLQPTRPGNVSALGAVINTAADNLRGQGATIRDTLIKLSQAVSAIADHSNDLFSTVRNLSILVSALHSSADLMTQLNQNLASVTGLLADDPDEVGKAVAALADVARDVTGFVAENRETLGSTADKLASVSQVLNASLGDIKQALHIAPTELQNFMNIYQPAQGTLSGAPAFNNFANPIAFLCGAIQAASRLGYQQSAKLCVQYLAPIIKNRQYNFPPLGENTVVGAVARPNEVTYSEDWLRPDYVPPQPTAGLGLLPLPAEIHATNPADGLPGLLLPEGGN